MAAKNVIEVEVDARRRVSLGRVGRAEDKRYFVQELSDGVIQLIPAVSVPAREALIWQNDYLRASLIKGMEQADSGELHDLGSFKQYAEDSD